MLIRIERRLFMFEVGEYIVYGSNGVCKVEAVGKLKVPGMSKDKLYYTLSPYNAKGSKIFTPVDNKKVVMRPVISKKEAIELIENIKNIDLLEIPDESRIEEEYKEALRKCDCRELVKLIRTINKRISVRLKEGKKITAGDEKYLQMAEEYLLSELSIPLEMEKEQVKELILKEVGNF